MIETNCFAPEKESVAFLCGPPAMIQKAVLSALTDKLHLPFLTLTADTYTRLKPDRFVDLEQAILILVRRVDETKTWT
jgi:hypothetical protein